MVHNCFVVGSQFLVFVGQSRFNQKNFEVQPGMRLWPGYSGNDLQGTASDGSSCPINCSSSYFLGQITAASIPYVALRLLSIGVALYPCHLHGGKSCWDFSVCGIIISAAVCNVSSSNFRYAHRHFLLCNPFFITRCLLIKEIFGSGRSSARGQNEGGVSS